jgi:hypothetical protein
MDRETPSFAVFPRFFWPRNPFRMNISKKSPQLFILKEMLSPLESAFTKKGRRGQQKGPEAFASGPRKFYVIATRLQLRVEEESKRKGEQRQRLNEHEA